MPKLEFDELVEKYMDQENFRFEGESGVADLCKLVNAIGYKDSMYFGQLRNGCCIGDLTNFLADNPGCIEAMVEWIQASNVQEWADALSEKVEVEDEEEEDDNIAS